MIIVAVKLFYILMNLGKIVLQYPVDDRSVHVFIILVLVSKQKYLY